MKHIFVFNPFAGPGTFSRENLALKLEQLGVDFEIFVCAEDDDIITYVSNRCKQTPDTALRFYACGGDGTVKQVANGIVGMKNAEFSVYPIGSGNDFVKYYGGKEKFLDLEALCNSEAHSIDLIRVGNEYSINVTNFGFESAVAETMSKVRRKKIIGGKNAYTTGIVKAIFTAMKNKGSIFVDGKLINDGSFLLCTIANSSYVGGSYKCAPKAVTNDGLLEVSMVKPISIFRFIQLIGSYKEGTHLDDPRFSDILSYRRAKSIHVTADKEFSICLDGEIRMVRDFTAEVVHNAVKFASPFYPEANQLAEKADAAAIV